MRSGVGVCDVSTLGKIELTGPDVGAFLDRVYANTFSTLPVGKARYGLMLREDGFVMDDGTTARLAPERFVMSTTTANAAKVMQHLEFCRQVLWPELDVAMHSVTERWAQFAVAGPRSRALLQNLFGPGVDLSNAAFPFMAAGEFALGGVTARLFRISFSGELAYEIAAPASYGDALIRALMAAGARTRRHALWPRGAERDADREGPCRGRRTQRPDHRERSRARPHDVGQEGLHRPRAGGTRGARRSGPADPRRAQAGRSRRAIAGGRAFLEEGAAATADNDEGYVTSVAFSPSLGHWIGLGLLKGGPARLGERVRAYDPVRNGDVEVEVCSPVFVDPQGERLHG